MTSQELQTRLGEVLKERTALLGSTLYRLTWKQRVTPLGRSVLTLVASGRPIGGSGFSGWPSPTTPSGGQTQPEGTTATGKTPDGRKVQVTLKDVAALAGWPTPTACSPNSLRGNGQDPKKRQAGGHAVNLQDAVRLTHWTTSDGPARLTASGEMLTGSSARMESGGQLNPDHSLWLMALPPVWSDCGVRAMQSLPKRRRRSSALTEK